MTNLRKAAEMALEVMEYNRANGTPNMGAAIEALRQALAQPEQTPVAYVSDDGASAAIVLGIDLDKLTPLYTAPPKREWVGLTDEDLKPLCSEWRIMYGGYVDDFAKAIEAKLKEKNS